MRITNSMVVNNLLGNLGKNASRMVDYQNQVQTGRKFNKPSDDPIGASYSVQYGAEISKENQYATNIDLAKEYLSATETALTSCNSVLSRINELTVQGSASTISSESRVAIKNEVEELRKELISIANTSYNGRYLFSGYQTDKPLMNEDGTYAITLEETETINYKVGQANSIQANVLGDSIFGAPLPPDVPVGEVVPETNKGIPSFMATIDELIVVLDANDVEGIGKCLGKISDVQDQVLAGITEIGGRVNRLSLAAERATGNITNLTKARSLNDEVDLAEAITNYSTEKTIYDSALKVGASIIQQTLLDYL